MPNLPPLPLLPPLPPGARSRSAPRWLIFGCVGGVVLAAAAAAAGGLFLLKTAMDMARGEAYDQAMARLRRHPAAVEALGEPMEAGWFLSGRVQVTGPSGTASLAIPVSGPKQAGTLYVEALKEAGLWELRRLELAPRNGGRIDLRFPAGGGSQ